MTTITKRPIPRAEDWTPGAGSKNEALDGILDAETIRVLVQEVLASKESARGWCPDCSKQVRVEIHDARAVTTGISELLNQAKGPGQESEQGGGTVVHYYSILTCNHGHDDQVSINDTPVTDKNGSGADRRTRLIDRRRRSILPVSRGCRCEFEIAPRPVRY
jgi:hypothetical protein